MAAVAANKRIRLQTLEVQIRTRIQEGRPWQTDVEITLDLGAGLDTRQHAILSRCAGMCEIHKLLSGDVRFHYHLNPPQRFSNRR